MTNTVSVNWNGEDIRVRNVSAVRPSHFHLGDIICGPQGILLKVMTVQKGCPYIENLRHVKTVVIFSTESGTQIPVNGMTGEYDVYRK